MRLHTLFDEDRPERWAPMHAWRRLGQLKAKEAIEPLTKLFPFFDPLIFRDLPVVYAMIGPAAIPTLVNYVEDTSRPSFMRLMPVNCLRQIADMHPEVADLCETILVEQLEKHADQSPAFNGFLVRLLVEMETSAYTVLMNAYLAGHVDEKIAGSWKDNAIRLGIRASDELRSQLGTTPYLDDDEEDDFLKPTFTRKSGSDKKKSRRKQAARSQKLNRKKRR